MILAIIPARYASTRFPGKPLVQIQGKSMIQRVWEQTGKSKFVQQIAVATDDERIHEHVLAFGGISFLTSPDHPSGTDRCAEVASYFPEANIILNVQGDEPFIQAEQIDLLAEFLQTRPEFPIATLVKQIETEHALFNPNVVKAVFSETAGALYFSRQALPYFRGSEPVQWLQQHAYFKHIGLYGFQRNALIAVSQLAPASLELAESLEQLRWLSAGYRIGVAITTLESHGIDTPEDLKVFLK